MNDFLKGAAAVCLMCGVFIFGVTIGMSGKNPNQRTLVQTIQMQYLPDITKTPSAEQYNSLLHALQDSRLMAVAPLDKTPKSDWLHWWSFP